MQLFVKDQNCEGSGKGNKYIYYIILCICKSKIGFLSINLPKKTYIIQQKSKKKHEIIFKIGCRVVDHRKKILNKK